MTASSAAARALEPVRPTGTTQVRPAMGVIRELVLKLDECARKPHCDFLLGSHQGGPPP